MKRNPAHSILVIALFLIEAAPGAAQRPDTRFFEHLTFDEIRDLIQGGAKNVILATGGTEDNGPYLALGRHNDVVAYAADRIARSLGNTLIAPVIAYAPQGSGGAQVDPQVLSVSLPEDRGYVELLEAAAGSLRGSGFRNIIFIGDSAGSQAGMHAVAEKLNVAWKDTGVRVLYISDYYIKARADQEKYITEKLGVPPGDLGIRANILDASEVMAVNSPRVRLDTTGLRGPASRDSGDLIQASPQLGVTLLRIKIDNAVVQVQRLIDQGRNEAGSMNVARGPLFMASLPLFAGGMLFAEIPSVTVTPGVFLEDLTSSEVREAIAGGNTVAIIPTGGTEKNGYHMIMGKHNLHVRKGAESMAKKLGTALVAPVLQYVPEGQATENTPGVLSCPQRCFENIVEAVARDLKAAGFKDILLVGDNGGNQTGLGNVAEQLNKEWQGSDVTVFALTDFYDKGHEYQDAWLLAQFGWDASIVGSHAGIKDTSQMLYVNPEGVRKNRIWDSFNNKQESGISGDPTKATEEFGRVAIEFKANAAIAQYRVLKAAAGTVK